MKRALPSVHTNLQEVERCSARAASDHSARVDAALRSTVGAPGFPALGFVRDLIRYRMALQDDWRRRMDRQDEEDNAPNKYRDLLIARIQHAGSEDERAHAGLRYSRWTFAKIARDSRAGRTAYDGAESTSSPGFVSSWVFDTLDEALLLDRPGLVAMLADRASRRDALGALARIGTPAVAFAPPLFDRIDEDNADGYSLDVQALGRIGRDDPGVIDGLLRRVRSGSPNVQQAAIAALGSAGPPLAGRLGVALDLLQGATHRPDLACIAIQALASVGHDDEAAFRRVLGLAGSRPPRWRSEPGIPDYRQDEVMMERAAAIDSFVRFPGHADRIVPVLVAALDTFEEYDSDWMQNGQHERICEALRSFGPDAAPAVPRLLRSLEEQRAEGDRGHPRCLLNLIAAIGPPVGRFLPLLERMRVEEFEDEAEAPEFDPDRPLDRAILTLRAGTTD